MKPHLINDLRDKSLREIYNLSDYGTPRSLRFKNVRPMDETEKIECNQQSNYCSRMDMLLYLIKYSILDLENVIRELSKCMEIANLAAYKEMLRVVIFWIPRIVA
jgi:hypothetical protein